MEIVLGHTEFNVKFEKTNYRPDTWKKRDKETSAAEERSWAYEERRYEVEERRCAMKGWLQWKEGSAHRNRPRQ